MSSVRLVTLAICSALTITASAYGNPQETDAVLRKVIEHYQSIRSMRIRGVCRNLVTGPVVDIDRPEAIPSIYNPDGTVEEFEHWASPPKLRRFTTWKTSAGAIEGRPHQLFFDGQVCTQFRPLEKQAIVDTAGASVAPLSQSPLHAVGFCYPFTFQSSFAELLSDRNKVTVTAQPDRNGLRVWLLEVSPLPDSIRPKWCEPHNRKYSLSRIWLSVEPEVIVWKWAKYERWLQPPGKRVNGIKLVDGKIVPNFDRPELTIPDFDLDDFNLIIGFALCHHRHVTDATETKRILMPHRVLFGNNNVMNEYSLTEVAVNPAENPDSFRPTIPSGSRLHQVGGTAKEAPSVTGGSRGETLRVHEITQEARNIMAGGHTLQSSTQRGWKWLLPAICLFLGLTGLVLSIRSVIRKRRAV